VEKGSTFTDRPKIHDLALVKSHKSTVTGRETLRSRVRQASKKRKFQREKERNRLHMLEIDAAKELPKNRPSGS
jgi:hypothetical protein